MASTAMIVVMVISLFCDYPFVYGLGNNHSQNRKKRSQAPGPAQISGKYKTAARSELLATHNTFDKKPMSRLTLSCRNKAYYMILSDYPFAEVRWKHNGKNFALQPSRMVTGLNSVTIQNLIPEDSGVYHCVLSLSPKLHVIVAVFSVIVGNETKHVTNGDSMTLKCHGKELGKIFKNATRVWIDPKNGTQLRKSAIDESEDMIEAADEKSAGIWLCQVEDKSTSRVWKTARINLHITAAPTGLKKIIKYSKTHKAETVAILFAGTFVLVLIMNGLTKIVEWRQNKYNSELEEIKKVLGIDKDNLASDNVPLLLAETDEKSPSNETSDDDSNEN